MPLVRISVIKGRSTLEKRAIMDAVRKAITEALKVPESAITIMLSASEREFFDLPPGKSGKYVIIEVTMFPGRSKESKKGLYAAVVQNLSNDAGVEPNEVSIVVHEPPMENWGIRAGMPADEVDLGYVIDV